jgi:alkaline phosphatase D
MKACFVAATFFFIVQLMTADLVSSQVLTHGPLVGGVTESQAKVFVRTDQSAPIIVRYGTDPTLNTYSESPNVTTYSNHDFTATISLRNLSPEATYYLNPTVNGVTQLSPPFPSFTTFPPTGTGRDFSFVVLTDFATIRNLNSSVQTFASAAARNPAFAFIGGDFDHRNPSSLAAKRQMFKDLYDPNTLYMDGFVDLILRKMPIAHQWDDHDSGEDNLDKTYPDWNLTQQAYQEYVPCYTLPLISPGIWQKFSYAQADFFVLDCRSQRDRDIDPDDSNKSMLDGNALGASGELHWLRHSLLASTARWKIIFTSVVINPTTKRVDGWASFQTEWNALRDFIDSKNIRGVVFISGDLHLGAIDNGTNAGFPEMCVAQANGNESECPTGRHPGVWSEGYYSDMCNGFGLVTISHNPDQLVLQAADQYGNVHVSLTVE